MLKIRTLKTALVLLGAFSCLSIDGQLVRAWLSHLNETCWEDAAEHSLELSEPFKSACRINEIKYQCQANNITFTVNNLLKGDLKFTTKKSDSVYTCSLRADAVTNQFQFRNYHHGINVSVNNLLSSHLYAYQATLNTEDVPANSEVQRNIESTLRTLEYADRIGARLIAMQSIYTGRMDPDDKLLILVGNDHPTTLIMIKISPDIYMELREAILKYPEPLQYNPPAQGFKVTLYYY